MIKRDRSFWMQEINENIRQEFNQKVLPALEKSVSDDLWGWIITKMQTPAIRPFFVFAVAQYIDCELEEPMPENRLYSHQLPLIAELVMLVMYFDNFILDGKGGTMVQGATDRKAVNRNLLGKNILRQQIDSYIFSEIKLPLDKQVRIVEQVGKMFLFTDIGQYWDKNTSGFEQFNDDNFRWTPASAESEKFLQEMLFRNFVGEISLMDWLCIQLDYYSDTSGKKMFIQHYFRRISLENAAFFVLWVEIIASLKDIPTKVKDDLKMFAFVYGIMSQIVNENVDTIPSHFAPYTASKKAEDFCADIRNGLVTLPLIIYFSQGNHKKMHDLQLLLLESDLTIYEELKATIWHKARPFAQTLTKAMAKNLNKQNNWYKNLEDMSSYAFSPRLYKWFKI